jgi:hypothetical protein
MVVVANTLYGDSGLICFPSGISGTIYFADGAPGLNGDSVAVIRSYNPAGGLVDDVITGFVSVWGVNPIFDGTQLSVVVSQRIEEDLEKLVILYDPNTGARDNIEITTITPYPLPYTCSISGDTNDVFLCNKMRVSEVPGGIPSVCMYDKSTFTWTKITTDDLEIPEQWHVVDMVLVTNYGAASVGSIYLHTTIEIVDTDVSSAIIMYTLPAVAPFTSGTWTDVTPTQLSTGIYTSPDKSQYSHTGLATVTTRLGSDSVFAKFWFNDTVNTKTVVLRHVSGTEWEETGSVPIDPQKLGYLIIESVFRETTSGDVLCGTYFGEVPE